MTTLSELKKQVSRSEGKSTLLDNLIIIYGEKGVGKSSEAARLKNPLFFDFEGRLDQLKNPVDKIVSDSFSQVSEYVTALLTSTPDECEYSTLVFDGGGNLFSLLLSETLLEYGTESWNDGALGYGKGRQIVIKRWREFISKLLSLRARGFTIVFTCHDTIVKNEVNGVPSDRRVPLFSGVEAGIDHGWAALRPSASLVLYVSMATIGDEEKVIVRTKPSVMVDACDPTPNGSLPVETDWDIVKLAKAWHSGVE